MFTEIKSRTDQIVDLLIKYRELDREVNLHYICLDCDDEQVTGDITIDDDLIDALLIDEYVMGDFGCNNCGHVTKFLKAENITGVEVYF